MICIETLPAMMTPLVNKFYQQIGARGRANKAERIWIARADGTIIGACRLSPVREDNMVYWLLAGLNVAPACQEQGIGTKLLEAVRLSAPGDVYTFPYRHLVNWYRQAGFEEAAGPDAIEQRFLAYRKQGRDIALMKLSCKP